MRRSTIRTWYLVHKWSSIVPTVFLRNVPGTLRPGDFADALIEDADAHDLYGVIA